MWWAAAWAASTGGDVGAPGATAEAAAWLSRTCADGPTLGRGWRLGPIDLWPDAQCDGHSAPVMQRDGVIGPATSPAPERAGWKLELEPERGRFSATAVAVGPGSLLHAEQFPGPAVRGLRVDGAAAWVVSGNDLWVVPAAGDVKVHYTARPHHTMCHIRRDEVMIAMGCQLVPLFGATRWSVEAAPLPGWLIAGPGEDLPVGGPALFAVKGPVLVGEADGVRVYGSARHPMPDATKLAERLSRNHHALSEALGPIPRDWAVLPVSFAQGWAASSGYPTIGAGHRLLGDGSAMAHEVAHAWFGSLVLPSFDEPGGHWHEALATWALADIDAQANKDLLQHFVNRFRKGATRRCSAELTRTTYPEASDGEKYGKGLTAMLTLDATFGRDRVVTAVSQWLGANAGHTATWREVIEAVQATIGPQAAAMLGSWLDGCWRPALSLEQGVLWLEDPVDPLHAIEGRVVVVDATYQVLEELPVQLGAGRVRVGVPAVAWAHAFLAASLPVEGPGISLSR